MSLIMPLVKLILENEDNSLRFENFCMDVYKAMSGVEMLPTSRTWDLSKDGRRVLHDRDQAYFMCVTVSKKYEKKISDDVLGLENSLIDSKLKIYLIIGLNSDISEWTVHGIETKVRGIFPKVHSIEILYLQQIAKLCENHPDVFLKHYKAEYEDAKRLLTEPATDSREQEESNLRIALSTQLQNDATQLRRELLRYLILSVLKDGKIKTSTEISSQLSKTLQLELSIAPTAIQSELSYLSDSTLITHDVNRGFIITDKGRSSLNMQNQKGAEKLLEGRKIFKQALESLSGTSLSSDEFAGVWSYIEQTISNLFYAKGIQVSKTIEAFVKRKALPAEEKDIRDIIDSLADKVAIYLSSKSAQTFRSKDVKQAIVDIFYGQDTKAFEWLSSLCIIYISLISLGLDETSTNVIREQFKIFTLLLDTDVVLNYLCAGEKLHEATKLILHKWIELGGSIMCSSSVLAEATHHAHIAEYEYRRLWQYLPEYTNNQALNELSNAFVRAFCKVARKDYSPRAWAYYIKNFRKRSPDDFTNILSILSDELGCLFFEEKNYDKKLASQITDYIFKIKDHEGSNAKILYEKSERDGLLLAAIAKHQETAKSSERKLVIISSSIPLEKTAIAFSSNFHGESVPVLPWSGITYLMSLLPETNLTITTISACLFDMGIHQIILPLEQVAMAVIRRTRGASLEYSRRVHLKESLQKSIIQVGKQEGRSYDNLKEYSEEISTKPERYTETSIEIIKNVVQELTVPKDAITIARLEKELREAKKQISMLQSKLK